MKDARDAEKRITNLEHTRKQTAKALLFENLDQAQRIETAVERGQSVAAFARQAGIEERRAQRLYKLAARSDKIRQEVRAGEARYGDDFVCPSWKQFLRPVSTEPEDNRTELKLDFDALSEELAGAQSRIAELEAQRLKNRYGMFKRGSILSGKPLNGFLITMTANSTLVWMSAPPKRTKSAAGSSPRQKMACGETGLVTSGSTRHTANSNGGAKRLGSTLRPARELLLHCCHYGLLRRGLGSMSSTGTSGC